MSKVLLALTSAALIALAGCATQQAAEPAKPTLSAEAKAALAAAEAAVKEANAKFALWTTADDALKAAQAAAEKGDSETVIKQSNRAQEQVKLGIAQLNYPLLKIGD
jgi:murein lipoprotein